MNKKLIWQYAKYLFRWQLSTPILAVCVAYIPGSTTWKTVVANLIGGLIFFWCDKYLVFNKEST